MNFKWWLIVGPVLLAEGPVLRDVEPALGAEAAGASGFGGPEAPGDGGDRDGATAHPFRLSVADVIVSGASMEVRIRFFWDDLQIAVMESESDMDFRLAETPGADSVVARYIGEMLVFEAGGEPLAGVLAERGVEEAARIDEVMWWYRLRYELPPGTERIGIRNRVLFNMFEDQRNLVHLKTRSGRERTYYFTWDDDRVAAPIG